MCELNYFMQYFFLFSKAINAINYAATQGGLYRLLFNSDQNK